MVIFHFPWRQRAPSSLKPNCLLTRHPVYFLKNRGGTFFDRIDPWRGIPRFLKNHGYDVKVVSEFKNPISKFHFIVAGSDAGPTLLSGSTHQLASLTLVDPNFSPCLNFLENILVPKILTGTLLSAKGSFDLHQRASQRVAKTWGPTFENFQGTSEQLQGRPFGPEKTEAAHEFFLRHCIFLAEYDLTTAQ